MTMFGLIISTITMLLWGLDLTLVRFVATQFHSHPMVFTAINLIAASLILILVAGPGRGGIETLRQPHTWMYGVFQILLNIVDMSALIFVATTEKELIYRATIIMALIMSWVFLRRRPYISDYIGSIVLIVGLVYTVAHLDGEIRFIATFLLLLGGFLNTCRAMIAEVHPESVKALTVKQRCRVTGYVLLVTSFVLLLFVFALAALKVDSPFVFEGTQSALSFVPSLDQVFDPKTAIAATLMGAFVLAPAMYFFFYSAVVVKTENFMILNITLPLIAFGFEWIFAQFGMLDISSITREDLIAGIIIIAASLYMAIARLRIEKKKEAEV